MSEEEMIDIAEKIANFGWSDYDDFEINKKAIQGLLDLYKKEKNKNSVSKDKIRKRYEQEEIDIQDIVMIDLEKYGFDVKDEFAIDLICKINEVVQTVKQLDKKIKEKQ